jgi:tetratricopeptide (TPR) repeat protein
MLSDSITEIQRLNAEAKAIYHQDPARAEGLARKAEALAREIGDEAGLAESLTIIADVCLRTDRYAEGINAAREALSLFTMLNDIHGEARALNLIGNIHNQHGRNESSLSCLSRKFEVCGSHQ